MSETDASVDRNHEASTPPLAASPPARSSRLGRRLPVALLIVGVAIGLGFGLILGTSGPGASASASTGVSPEQISQALSGVGTGASTANDRGFSLLENGVQHSHGFDLPLSPAERTELSHQMDLARQTALEYPTLADAQAAGAFRAGPFVPGLGTHMVMVSNFTSGPGAGPITDQQIRHPLAWIYDGTRPDSPVVGLFYNATVEDPAGFAGPNDVWHKHTGICITRSTSGGIDAPLGADGNATKAQCDALGGKLLASTGPLLHVWIVPGYEDSQGVYAHLNPAITCNDGTYHVVDLTKVGVRTSACADGTE